MVRGADYNFIIRVKNRATGQLIDDPELVDGLIMVLTSSVDRKPFKRYVLGDGIEKIEPGMFKVSIPSDDTLSLPPSSTAILEGFTLPVKHPIRINLGVVSDNAANYNE